LLFHGFPSLPNVGGPQLHHISRFICRLGANLAHGLTVSMRLSLSHTQSHTPCTSLSLTGSAPSRSSVSRAPSALSRLPTTPYTIPIHRCSTSPNRAFPRTLSVAKGAGGETGWGKAVPTGSHLTRLEVNPHTLHPGGINHLPWWLIPPRETFLLAPSHVADSLRSGSSRFS